jgi:hypothetical protein
MNDSLIFFVLKGMLVILLCKIQQKYLITLTPLPRLIIIIFLAKKGKIIIIVFQSTTNESKPTIKIAIVNHPSFVVSFI